MSEPIYKFDEVDSDARLREMILYISQRCADHALYGATKLNKILCFSDFICYLRHGKPVTGVEYMREQYGPVPRRLMAVKKELQAAGHLAIEPRQIGERTQDRPVALRNPDLSHFDGESISIVEEIIEFLKGKSADEVSSLTHDWTAWKVTKRGEAIPYQSLFLENTTVTDDDIESARALNAQFHWETCAQ